MTIRAALHSILINDAATAALVSTRVYRQVIPQQGNAASYMPAITYQLESRDIQQRHIRSDGTRGDQFQVDAYAVTQDQAEAVSEALIAALQDYRGTIEGRRIRTIALLNAFDLEDIEPGLYRVSHSFSVWHSPAESP